MASQRCIPFLSIVVVFVLFYISWYACSFRDHDYESGFARAYTWCMKIVEDLMFQDSNVFDQVSTKTFDVDSFGAKGDGKKDDTKAFTKAWKEACSSTTGAIFSVPKNKKYLVAPIRFKGPCKASLTMQISGTILASKTQSKYKKDEKHWLRVDEVDNLLIEGGGVIDGNGDIWWKKSCKVDKNLPCKDAPTALTLYKCSTLVVNNLKVQNAQQIHVSFDTCENVKVSNIQVDAPEDSPNTDGIHVTRTQNIKISDSVIGTGDDCISIVDGSNMVQATGITCGPGHGISIGSLGSKKSEAHVSNVTVDGAKLTGTTNGVRIKTWQGGSGNASNITFLNINMKNVTNPIIIDQNYCDQDDPCKGQVKQFILGVINSTQKNLKKKGTVRALKDSAVEIKDVTYENIIGTSSAKDAVIFDCSKKQPCQGIVLREINLTQEGGGEANAICNNVELTYIGTVIPRCPKNIIRDQRALGTYSYR